MNDEDQFKDIQRLIRLKRHESPGEAFAEEFLKNFHQRQREEMLNKSSMALFFERISTRFDAWLSPKWALAGAFAAVTVIAGILYSFNAPAAVGVANQTEPSKSSADPADATKKLLIGNQEQQNGVALPASHKVPEEKPTEEELKKTQP